jgi:hypothetical protein
MIFDLPLLTKTIQAMISAEEVDDLNPDPNLSRFLKLPRTLFELAGFALAQASKGSIFTTTRSSYLGC